MPTMSETGAAISKLAYEIGEARRDNSALPTLPTVQSWILRTQRLAAVSIGTREFNRGIGKAVVALQKIKVTLAKSPTRYDASQIKRWLQMVTDGLGLANVALSPMLRRADPQVVSASMALTFVRDLAHNAERAAFALSHPLGQGGWRPSLDIVTRGLPSIQDVQQYEGEHEVLRRNDFQRALNGIQGAIAALHQSSPKTPNAPAGEAALPELRRIQRYAEYIKAKLDEIVYKHFEV